MKRKLKNFAAFVMIMLSSMITFGDNFTVIVPSTYRYSNLLPPVKPGSSQQFQISIKK